MTKEVVAGTVARVAVLCRQLTLIVRSTISKH